jgi:hypothetical protein
MRSLYVTRRSDTGLSPAVIGALLGLTVLALVVFGRELPALRRYFRMRGM